MIGRKALAAAGIVLAIFQAEGCAPQRAVLLPSPPVEVRKEPPLPRAEAAKEQPPPGPLPLPDHDAMYREAIVRTKAAIGKRVSQEAIHAWKALEDSPWQADAVYHQGVLLHLAGDLDNAAAQYRRVLEKAPRFEPAAANLLGIYLLRGEREEMEALVSRILPTETQPPPEMLPELQANLGAALLEMGKLDDASLIFFSLQGRSKATPAIPWNLTVLAYRSGDRETARRLSDGLSPPTANLFPVVASRVAWARETDDVPAIGALPPPHPRLAALSTNLSAFSEYRTGNLEAAERLLDAPAGDRAAMAELVTNLGLVQMERGSWKEARSNLERAVRLNPEMPEGWLNLGIFREIYLGDAEGARECYGKYVTINGFRKKEAGAWLEWLERHSPQQPQR